MGKNRKDTRLIFVHCSATTAKQDIGAQEINKWHLERGFFSDRGLTGYHFIIRRNGKVELGRDLPAIGAQVQGFNDHSVGVVLVGGIQVVDGKQIPDNNFTAEQFNTLETVIRMLKLIYAVPIAPHNAVAAKACPSFDLWAWQKARFGYSDEEAAKKVIEELRRDA